MLIKQKISSFPRNLALGTFGELLIVFSTKVNVLYLHYSTARRYCVLHLIKQNCLLKTFLRTLILMTWVSLYLFLLELIWNCMIFLELPRCIKTLIHQRCLLLKNCEPEFSYIRVGSRIWMQFLFFANALFWASGDSMGLEHSANFCKQVAFAAGV